MGQDIFQKYSFWRLLNQEKNVVIPIIQRPYTQGGRDDNETIREKGERFCQYLISRLKANQISDVNIVYGAEEDREIELLDGQQRMTTLYLIYWYIGYLVYLTTGRNVLGEHKNTFKNFTYKTRITTRRFFHALVEETIERTEGKICEQIKEQGWYNPLWKNDQSVYSALSMIEIIEDTFEDADHELPYSEYWERMISEDNCPFIFSYTTLKDIDQTDDLYIKMNARGKQLTPFENMKAGLTKIVEDGKWEEDEQVTEKFNHKIDTIWTDIFWKFRNKDNNKIDVNIQAFMAAGYIKYIARTKGKEAKDKAVKVFGNVESLEHGIFTDKDCFLSIKEDFNLLEKAYKSAIYTTEIPLNNTVRERRSTTFKLEDFIRIVTLTEIENTDGGQSKDLNWASLVYLMAILNYFKNVKNYELESFSKWIRVIRNIVNNNQIDSFERFLSYSSLIDELTQGAENIYDYLKNNNIKSNTASVQIEEEILKATYRIDKKNDDIINRLEDTDICNGKLDFFMECSDIRNTKIFDANLFENYIVIADKYFIDSVSDEFRAAMFLMGDHCFYHHTSSYNYNNYLEEQKFSIIEYGSLKDLIYNYKYKALRPYLIEIVKALISNNNDVKTLLENNKVILTPGWKMKIVNNPKILEEYCWSKNITVGDDHCYLLNIKKARYDYQCHEIK